MNATATKQFEIRGSSTANMWYEIHVLFRGRVVDHFLAETMADAFGQLHAAGYMIEPKRQRRRTHES